MHGIKHIKHLNLPDVLAKCPEKLETSGSGGRSLRPGLSGLGRLEPPGAYWYLSHAFLETEARFWSQTKS